MESTIKIRTLKHKDVVTLSKIISKMVVKLGDDSLTDLIKAADADAGDKKTRTRYRRCTIYACRDTRYRLRA